MNLRLRFLGLVLLLSGLLLGTIWTGSAAQTVPGQGWSLPINLSESVSSSGSPTIVADGLGFVHVFWSELLNGPPHPEGTAPEAGNAILYRRLENGQWTKSVDIFYGGEQGRLDDPEAVVDEQGTIHLVWRQNAALFYSQAKGWEADQVAAWSEPLELVPSLVGDVRVLLTGDKVLVIYNQVLGDQIGLYALDIESGQASVSVLIWRGPGGLIPSYFSAAVDGRGRIHVAWEALRGTDTSEMEVYYTLSEDGGSTWSESRLVAKGTSEEDRIIDAAPWVFAHGDDEIHLQWAQGMHTYRWHQFSRDGGRTWTKAEQLWTDLISQTRSHAIGEDGEGNLYWADVLRYPNGGYLIRWLGDEWQQPELFYNIFMEAEQPVINKIHLHGIRMAILLGNEMHLVFKDQDRAEIWHMSKPLEAARFAARPIPIQAALPSPTPAFEVANSLGDSLLDSRPTQVLLPMTSITSVSPRFSASPGFGIVAGAVPVLFLLSLVILKSLWKGK